MSMMEFLTYDLKAAALLAVFYMFYRLLLSRETFHRINRVVLLLTAILSFVLPLCVITIHKTVVVDMPKANIDFDGMTMMIEEAEPQTPFWQTAAVIVFFIGLVVTLGYTLQSILRVWLLIHHSEQHPQSDGTVICVTKGNVSPFSWMRYIVLSQSDYEAQDASILAHERGHIRRHHSLDLILVDTLTALQWFNPAMWMLRQDLRAIHEYEADAAVLSQGINMRQYQYLLIQKAVSHCGYSVANGISHSTLKNRINMMLTNKKSTSKSWIKVFALLPIVGLALALNAETVNDYVYKEEQQQPQAKIVKKGKKDAQIKMGAKTIEVKAKEVKDKAEASSKEKVATGVWESNKKQDSSFAIQELIKRIPGAKLDEEGNVTINGKKVKKVLLDGMEISLGDNNEVVSVTANTMNPLEVENVREEPLDVVEEMPKFPGGDAAMMEFLRNTVKYPEEAMKNGIQGRVVVQFIIEKDGSISGAEVIKKVNEHLDAEALRVIGEMPKWTPGKQKGEAVRVKFTLPVTFRLS